ncbi:hypothetical protein BASA82_000569 [Batrachochytrium salamandrivorans]|nr:hypothetical protein BASA82_000569 [Batrachochytrium salamandrivorans]
MFASFKKKPESEKQKRRHSSPPPKQKGSFNQSIPSDGIALGEVLGLSLSLRIPFARSGLGESKASLKYVIFCTLARPLLANDTAEARPIKSWEVAKDFEDFKRMSIVLGKWCPTSASQLAFPKRSWFRSEFDPKLVCQRKRLFLEYLQSILSNAFHGEEVDAELAKFLCFPGIACLPSAGFGSKEVEGIIEPTALEGGTALVVGQEHHGYLFLRRSARARVANSALVFCVLNLEDGWLRYHGKGGKVLMGELQLRGKYGKTIVLERYVSGTKWLTARTIREGFGFSLWLPPPGEELLFYAETEEDRQMWIAALNSLLVSTVVVVPAPSQTRSGKGFSPKRPRRTLDRQAITPYAAWQRPAKEIWRNWSNSHSFTPKVVHRPETIREVEFVLNLHDSLRMPLGVVGAGLSPNGLGFAQSHLISLAKMNRMLELDVENKQATFECGITIEDALEELKPFGLMLPNLASINLQQLGGFYSVGAHGTGSRLPPVEEQIVSLTIATPGWGVVEVDHTHPQFDFFKLGLGLLGVVVKVKVQLVDIYHMRQTKQVFAVEEFSKQQFANLVTNNEHVKFMWIPHENKTVACYSNRVDEPPTQILPVEPALKEMRELYFKQSGKYTQETSFADLRALLLQASSSYQPLALLNIALPPVVEAKMSPAFDPNPNQVFSWIGVVMYLPPGDNQEEITAEFNRYCDVVKQVCDEVGAEIRVHWAKLEIDQDGLQQQQQLTKLYPVREFNDLRGKVDPNSVLQTSWSLAVFGQ